MKVRFVSPPFADQSSLVEVLSEWLTSVTDLKIIVAWAKHSGFSRLSSDLLRFKSGGNASLLIVGIDEAGATRQGLENALELFDHVYVLHDKSGRTFHPKLYVLENSRNACLIVGSNNLTAGGVYFNYEAFVVVELDRSALEDEELLQEVYRYIERLLVDNTCLELTNENVHLLIGGDRYGISDEARPRVRQKGRVVSEDSDSAIDAGEAPLFGTSHERKKADPRRTVRRAATRDGVFRELLGENAPASGLSREAVGATDSGSPVVRRWFEQLTNSDSQQPQLRNSNPTGNMRLTKARLAIDHTTYFRQVFFELEEWRTLRGTLEEADVRFDVFLREEHLGVITLKVDHDPKRIANQKNAPTFLHWGEQLGERLRQRNFAGAYVTLEQLRDGSYRLSIAGTAMGVAQA